MSRVRVLVEPELLDPDSLRRELEVEGCGSVVSFVGLTRGVDDGIPVERLEFDAWEEGLPGVLNGLAEKALDQFGVSSVVLAHRTGAVGPGEPIVCIHIASAHRAEGFEACSWLIDELKRQAPLWKKEVRADGEMWKAGLG
ncbi:MAG: molybdenum cofactor biosynthesis protein MoaE [Candidatus Thermoplasmatota archaeon]|nr:molybdenum cofactor biosynthesis protein MoaE [Candidatus Thermoplasmatota archaeon]